MISNASSHSDIQLLSESAGQEQPSNSFPREIRVSDRSSPLRNSSTAPARGLKHVPTFELVLSRLVHWTEEGDPIALNESETKGIQNRYVVDEHSKAKIEVRVDPFSDKAHVTHNPLLALSPSTDSLIPGSEVCSTPPLIARHPSKLQRRRSSIKKRVEKVVETPSSTCALSLGVVSLGHAWNHANVSLELWDQEYSNIIMTTFGCFGSVFLLTYILKVVLYPTAAAKDVTSPSDSATIATAGMAMLNIAAAFRPYHILFPQILWRIGVFTCALTGINFYVQQFRFIRRLQQSPGSQREDLWKKVLNEVVKPAWAPPMVGIALATVSCSGMESPRWVLLGCLYVPLVNCGIVVPLVLLKLAFGEPITGNNIPSQYILFAPLFLTLSAWLQLYPTNTSWFTHALLLVACGSFVLVNVKFTRALLKIPFTPGFASLTFPLDAASVAVWKYEKATGWYISNALAFLMFTAATFVVMTVFILAVCLAIKNVAKHTEGDIFHFTNPLHAESSSPNFNSESNYRGSEGAFQGETSGSSDNKSIDLPTENIAALELVSLKLPDDLKEDAPSLLKEQKEELDAELRRSVDLAVKENGNGSHLLKAMAAPILEDDDDHSNSPVSPTTPLFDTLRKSSSEAHPDDCGTDTYDR